MYNTKSDMWSLGCILCAAFLICHQYFLAEFFFDTVPRYELCTCTLMNMKSDGMLGAQVCCTRTHISCARALLLLTHTLLLSLVCKLTHVLSQVLQNPRKVDELVAQVAGRGYSPHCVDFIRRCLVANPADRWSAKQLQVLPSASYTAGRVLIR